MPTLVNETEETYYDGGGGSGSGGETVGASGMLWLAENLKLSGSAAAVNYGDDNDSTMSGSFLESMLEDMRRKEVANAETQQQRSAAMTQQQHVLLPDEKSFRSRSLSRTLSDEDLLTTQQQQLESQTGLSETKEPTTRTLDGSFAVGMIHEDDSIRSLSRTLNEDEVLLVHKQLETPLHAPLSDNENMQRTLNEGDKIEQQLQRKQASQYVEKLNESSSQRSVSHHESLADAPILRKRSPRPERKMGPNEQLYNQKYSALVANRIQAFRSQYPGQIPDYHNMPLEEKLFEQQCVMRLLQRLNITNNKENLQYSDEEEEVCLAFRSKPVAKDMVVHDNDDSISTYNATNDQSMLLLSPTTKEPPHSPSLKASSHHQRLFSPIATEQATHASMALLSQPKQWQNDGDDYPDADPSDDNSSTQSIEISRAADRRYESPEAVRQHKKRLASTSGKRGADLVRARRREDDDDSSLDAMQEAAGCSPSKSLVNSIGRLSLADEMMFSSSQSPIAHQLTHSPMLQHDRSPIEYTSPDISFGADDDDSDHRSAATKSRPVYDNDSLIETAMLPDKRVRWDFDGKLTKEAPTDVRLLDGKTIHWPTLPTERRQRTAPPTQSFPDPLSFYPDKLKRRLIRLYSWLLQRDQLRAQDKSIGTAVVLSMQEQQIIDVILKLHLDYPPSEDVRSSGTHGPLLGNTLIVARSKEELEVWARSFREGSSFSVLIHSALPMSQRKSLSSAEKSVQFDVVFTTYDALKSSDITVTLDRAGFAVNTKIGVSDGWYTSASQNVEQVERSNKQFSVLHRIYWRRLIFLDVVGRKSYLAKSGTARVQAARALNADARLAFFVMSDDKETTGVQAFLKSDRNAIPSLSSVLRLEDDGSDGTALRASIVDFRDKSAYLAMKKN